HPAGVLPGHPLQKRTKVQWDIGAALGADDGADEFNVSAGWYKSASPPPSGKRERATRAKQLAGPRDRLMSGEFHRRLKRIGTVRSTRTPGNSRGGAGKGCARRNSARASSSSALAPDECAIRLLITRPCRSRLKKTWATPCSRRDCAAAG